MITVVITIKYYFNIRQQNAGRGDRTAADLGPCNTHATDAAESERGETNEENNAVDLMSSSPRTVC